jgi:hypothetical protein
MQNDSTYHWTRPNLPLGQSCNHTVYHVNVINCKVPCDISNSDFLLAAVIFLILCAIFLCKFRTTLDVTNLILVCFTAFFEALQLTWAGMTDDQREEEDLTMNKSLEPASFFFVYDENMLVMSVRVGFSLDRILCCLRGTCTLRFYRNCLVQADNCKL